MLRFDRIQHLLSPEELKDKWVVQVGVGSGGASVNDHLTMNGIRRWILFDPDVYEDVNLVKHPRRRNQLSNLKVANQKEWILDRNPDAEVVIHGEDVLTSSNFQDTIKQADLLLCCADKNEVRSFVNTIAVEQRKPCVTASVFRQGFGGEVYAFIPNVSGCFDCMNRVASEKGWNLEGTVDLIPEEQEKIYGLNIRDFRASGLSMDIQTIAMIHARMALDILLTHSERKVSPLPGNWIIFYNRPMPNNLLSGFMKPTYFKVRPRKDCLCRGT